MSFWPAFLDWLHGRRVEPTREPRMIYQGKARYPVHEVILHTSATPPEWWHGKTVEQMRDMIDQWHRERGWRGIGYHLVIAPDGSTAQGRAFTEIGAHVKERNRGTIGICLIPSRAIVATGHLKTFDAYYTPAQRETVRAKIRALSAMTELRRVTGHNDYAAKTCPGFEVKTEDWL